ncbi:MAG: glycoside hydrolase family 9 protein [Cytophagaceae bacterium]
MMKTFNIHLSPVLFLLFLTLNANASFRVDYFEDGDKINELSAAWYTYTDGYSTMQFAGNSNPGANGSQYAASMSWQFKAGAPYQYIGINSALSSSGSPKDLSSYAGIRFKVKGNALCNVQIPIQATQAEYNHYSRNIIPGSSWQTIELPFSSFAQTWGTAHSFNLATILSVQFNIPGSAGGAGEIYLDEIEFYTSSEAIGSTLNNPVVGNPKVNQVGYLPDSEKFFVMTYPFAGAAARFDIVSAADSLSVYTGFCGALVDDSSSTGEKVIRGDFSAFAGTGTFRVKINGNFSEEFTIAEDAYQNLFKDALRTFFINRCGTAVNDQVGHIDHPACHMADTLVRSSQETNDFTGGWHNAGDFGKWSHMAGINVSYMMWLYEFRQDAYSHLQINIPESGNQISDLLDEAKWGLLWLLKMQKADGSVFHKVDTQPDFAFGKSPEQDSLKRYAAFQSATEPQDPSTIDAAHLVASMLQAYRVFKDIDPVFAVQCRDAALLSWAWIQNNPPMDQSDLYYTDHAVWQELLWAKAEMARYSNDPLLRSEINDELQSLSYAVLSWDNPECFAFWTIYEDENSTQQTRDMIKAKISSFCNAIKTKGQNNGYGISQGSSEYWWGSNDYITSKANTLLYAYRITGNNSYKNSALAHLDYLLGLNSLNKSFVTGYGTNTVMNPYHWTYAAYHKIMPGWPSTGPNHFTTGADPLLIDKIQNGTPPAKCYVDSGTGQGSWASNEGATSQTAGLMFLTGFLSGSENPTGLQPLSSGDGQKSHINTLSFSRNHLNVSLEIHKACDAEIYLYDTSGRIIMKNKKRMSLGTQVFECRAEDLKTELYIVKVIFYEDQQIYSDSKKALKE